MHRGAVLEKAFQRTTALAGIVGPIAFVLIYTALGILTPGSSQLTQVISNLELVQNGWIQRLNFLQCGSLIITFALGFRRTMVRIFQRHLTVVTALLVLSGAGMIEAAYFTPADPVEHAIGFLFFIVPLIAAFFVTGRQLHRTDSWRTFGRYSLATGFATTALLLFFFSQGSSESFGFIGVVNRLFVMESLAWFVVMGTRLARSAP